MAAVQTLYNVLQKNPTPPKTVLTPGWWCGRVPASVWPEIPVYADFALFLTACQSAVIRFILWFLKEVDEEMSKL